MQITLPTVPSVDIEIPDNADSGRIADILANLDAVRSIARTVGAESGFARYECSSQPIGEHLALSLADAYIENGLDGVADYIESEKLYNDPTDAVSVIGDELRAALQEIVQVVVSYRADVIGDELSDALRDRLESVLLDAMIESDKSTVLDFVSVRDDVEIAFIQGRSDPVSLMTSHYGPSSSLATIRPDANFLRFLQLVNYDVTSFVEMARSYGYDPVRPVIDPDRSELHLDRALQTAIEWKVLLDLERGHTESQSNLRLDDKNAVEDWNERLQVLSTIRDHDRPFAIEPDRLYEIVENATYGGCPTFVARVPLADLFQGAYDKPFLATGGMIGLHNFANGSGDIVLATEPVLIDPTKGSFYVHSTTKSAVNDVYMIVERHLRLKKAEPYGPSAWRQFPRMWRRDGEHGYVLITQSEAEDGASEYWVQSFDHDGVEHGPRATAEVFTNLAEAQKDGDHTLEALTVSGPTP